MLSISEKIHVPHPPDRVWSVVSDPQDVVSCIGGAALGASHDDGSFDGTLVVRFGGIRVRFGARVALDLDAAAREGRLSARGKDGQGATRFTAHATFRVAAGEDSATPATSVVTVDGEVQLNGKLSKLIESGAGAVISRMTAEFADALIRKCAPAEPQAERPATPEIPARQGLFARLRAWWAARRRPHRAASAPESVGRGVRP